MSYDVVEKTKEIYELVSEDLTIEKIVSVKPKIKEIANECRQRNLFKGENAQREYNEFLKELDGIEDKNRKLVAVWNHLDDRLEKAPTEIHFIGAIILVMPILDYVLDSF